jgi:hypothetical protein
LDTPWLRWHNVGDAGKQPEGFRQCYRPNCPVPVRWSEDGRQLLDPYGHEHRLTCGWWSDENMEVKEEGGLWYWRPTRPKPRATADERRGRRLTAQQLRAEYAHLPATRFVEEVLVPVLGVSKRTAYRVWRETKGNRIGKAGFILGPQGGDTSAATYTHATGPTGPTGPALNLSVEKPLSPARKNGSESGGLLPRTRDAQDSRPSPFLKRPKPSS